MGDFFKGWRRKTGCVLLVVAAALTGMWVRTTFCRDLLWFRFGNRIHFIKSQDGYLEWRSRPVETDDGLILKYRDWKWSTQAKWFPPTSPFDSNFDPERFRRWFLIYWHPSVSLILLSAYLILWKPRKKPST